MRVLYTLTLVKAVIDGQTRDEICIRWSKYHHPRVPFTVPLAWAATRECVLAHFPDVTDVEEAHLEVTFS